MTRDDVVSALQQVAQISSADFDAKYAEDAGVDSCRCPARTEAWRVRARRPSYLNGIKLPSLRPAYFDAALDWAIRGSARSS